MNRPYAAVPLAGSCSSTIQSVSSPSALVRNTVPAASEGPAGWRYSGSQSGT